MHGRRLPLGATVPEVKAYEAARAVADGACEVDMVLNVGALKSGDYRLWSSATSPAVVEASHRGGAMVKVIIEAALLTDDEKVEGLRRCPRRRAPDFVKTSTGFGPGGRHCRRRRPSCARVVGPDMGVKAAGGVRDLKSAQAMLDAGADRIGASVGREDRPGEPRRHRGRRIPPPDTSLMQAADLGPVPAEARTQSPLDPLPDLRRGQHRGHDAG